MKKETPKPSSTPQKPTPIISPHMIKETFRVLESKGMIYYSEGGIYVPTEKGWKFLMELKSIREEVNAFGHPNVSATHTTTFMITKSDDVTKDGACIIAVKSNKACTDFSKEFKHGLKQARKVEITIEAGDTKDVLTAYGSPALKLTDKEEIAIRKTDHIDKRTAAILADKSANELKQELIEKLRNPETQVKIIFEIK
jgi:hypothetical protein